MRWNPSQPSTNHNPMYDFSARLAQRGLSLQAWLSVASIEGLPEVLPGARSLWLLGSPGVGLWESFQAHVQEEPTWRERQDPFDDFVSLLLTEARPHWERAWGDTYTFTPSDTTQVIDFVGLATAAGWGMPGPFGVAIHPTYGPWFGLRAAILTHHVPDVLATPLSQPVCEGCDAPCQSACPVDAVTPTGWRFDACVPYRISDRDCQLTCHARQACPVGTEYRYTGEKLAFFMRHSLVLLQHHVGTDQE